MALDDLKQAITDIAKQVKDIKDKGLNIDTKPLEASINSAKSNISGLGTTTDKTSVSIKNMFGTLGSSILDAGVGAKSMAAQFDGLFGNTKVDIAVSGFDALTATTRNLRSGAIDVGNAFGGSFDEIRNSYVGYTASVINAQNYTYENRQEIQKHRKDLADLGITQDDVSQKFGVGGTQLDILSEGFLLSSDSGLKSTATFDLMGRAMTTMGFSASDAGKQILALENMSRATGLPIEDLSNKMFSTAEQGARLGLTIDSMTPIAKRLVDVLGPGFKGLAIKESTDLIKGLENQINTTNGAFIAMQGGLAKPGSSVIGAQLAFEDAFKNPIEILKSLQTTLAGVTGGKNITFEEARANPQLEAQFKIQRDLLQQLTGNNDAQSQRTIMSALADLQSGRQLSTTQNKSLEEALTGGAKKQEERASLQEKIGQAQVGLLTQIALDGSIMLEKIVQPQVASGIIRRGTEEGVDLEKRASDLFTMAISSGKKLLEENVPGFDTLETGINNGRKEINDYGASKMNQVRPGLNYTVPNMFEEPAPNIERAETQIPNGVQPSPFADNYKIPKQDNKPIQSGIAKAEEFAEKGLKEIMITFAGTDEIGRLMAQHATATIRNTNGGG